MQLHVNVSSQTHENKKPPLNASSPQLAASDRMQLAEKQPAATGISERQRVGMRSGDVSGVAVHGGGESFGSEGAQMCRSVLKLGSFELWN